MLNDSWVLSERLIGKRKPPNISAGRPGIKKPLSMQTRLLNDVPEVDACF